MPADFNHKRYSGPKYSRQTYTVWMKTLTSSAVYDAHDPVAFRLKVIEHARDFGWKAAVSAFGIGKSTLYDWKHSYRDGKGAIAAVIPVSTRPKHLRQMQTDPQVCAFIQSIRESDYPMSKYKIKPLLDAYCAHLEIASIATATIGKVIKKHRWFGARKTAIKRHNRYHGVRRKYAPKTTTPGHVEMDSIILYVAGNRWNFMSLIDVATRYGHCAVVTSVSSHEAV